MSNSTNLDFNFKYTESGGLTARYLTISYDSNTNVLTSSTDVSGSNISQRSISESDKIELKNAITENDFFNTKTDYPPEKEDPSLIAYSLTVALGTKTHATTWTNASKEVSNSIRKIVDKIKEIITKEKAV
jgi:hypothetical protein